MSRIQTVRICQNGSLLLSATSSGILQNTRPSSSSLFFTPLNFFIKIIFIVIKGEVDGMSLVFM
ncbi:hypothetical protein NC652_017181 [Populus alba x Populus x berolinensis]|uniref:Uncharacterized protein n=1 Tax=Populus alba x Populus x berolinensis TaxID=444605 RepID=A0AAD6QPP6_9ROSI|nr:hypothetical protein NC651_016630 [Populus alba x Populus x berolinensis]KAJ6923783.1 hypothetical protein NC652_017181 [Populus alba x Populus x berolinensis]KAJ6994205.1 hypothetical protein NC653_017125 [Populus alba x Populus x berolinensis]